MTAAAPPSPAAAAPGAPPIPAGPREVGLSHEFIRDLLLKTLYVQGARTGQQLTDALRLPFPVVDDHLLTLQQRRFVEVRNTSGPNRGSYLFDLVGGGRDRARDALEASQYVGPAPVPLAQYREWIARQSITHARATRAALARALDHLVLEPGVLDALGPAVNSGKSLFLFGHSGNGKTAIAEAIATMLGGEMYVPFAVDIDGQTMLVFDPVYHEPVDPHWRESRTDDSMDALWLDRAGGFDRRYAHVRRPVVMTGGELTLEQLDLQYDPFTKVYQAPFQVKANGGVLIVDDFGRQRVPPRDLLNRWIVPLEKRVDFLTLHTGGKFPIPFDVLLVFATNLKPAHLVEEAFLRRIHYKLEVPNPTRAEYERIFERAAGAAGIPWDPAAVERVFQLAYRRHGIVPRGCHPRDIVAHVVDIARYLELSPALSEDLLARACASYFLDSTTTGPAAAGEAS